MSDVSDVPSSSGAMRYFVTRDDAGKIRGTYRASGTSGWFNKGDGWKVFDNFLALWEDSDYEIVDKKVVDDWLKSRS